MSEWLTRNWICPCWSNVDPEPSVNITLDFSKARFSNLALDGLDLRFADLQRASFHGASLRRTRFDLSNLTGTCFLHTNLECATFEMASYDADHPPIGLAYKFLSQCERIVSGD